MRAHLGSWLVALAICSTACGSAPAERAYALQGQVLAIADDRQQATIKHEEIKGLMAGMTMTFKARDAQLLSGIKPGDLINATLVVDENSASITALKKVGEAPLEAVPAPTASSGFELLKPGEPLPETRFVDQDGKPRAFSDFRGSPVAITFIYTSCPIPDFCPRMDSHFASIQRTMATDPGLRGAHLVSISIDPVTDTPPVLKGHADRLMADPSRWSFLTGDRDDIDQFAARFGLSISRSPTNALDITHNLRTVIADSKGNLFKVHIGNQWTPDQVVADLKAAP
ncbi:MAG TPA: SCO family protein [Vicinamibacterales bacterium]|jgi:protein SCO1/2|nr:SCO family protein [Vicinamibacterales bacterium]